MAIDPAVIAATLVGCLLGGFVKGVTGSGLPQIAVPLIALATNVPTAVAMVQLPAMSINLLQARPQTHAAEKLLGYWPIFLTLFCATIIGVGLLKAAPPGLLFGFMGVLTIAAAMFLMMKPDFRLPAYLRLYIGVPVAVAAGLSAGLSSLAGPFLMPYLLALNLPKDLFISTISLCYLSIIVPTIVFFLYWELVDPSLFLFSILAVIPSIAGMIGGNLIRGRIDDRRFRKVVLAMLLITAAGLIIKAFRTGS